MTVTSSETKKGIRAVFLLAIILNFAVALSIYVNSTFLSDVTGSKNVVSLIFTAGSILAIAGLALIPIVLRRLGNFVTTLLTTAVAIIVLAGLAWFQSPALIILVFLIYAVMSRLLYYNFDLLLEHFSKDSITGRIRGAYLSAISLAFLAGPVAAGFILDENNYSRLYMLAALLLLITLPILIHSFRNYKDPVYKHTLFWKTIKNIYKRANMRRLFSAYILLHFFYAWMVIYTPIYLHEHIGLTWSTIGIVFTIMLLPFVLFEYPLGKIADTKLGEKELMAIGFVILAVTTATLTFITSNTWWVWAIALFATRVGASMVQSMGQIYFFKKTDDTDSELLGFFQMTGPMAFVIAPLVASLALTLVDFRFLYLILGALMLLGIPFAMKLKDTL